MQASYAHARASFSYPVWLPTLCGGSSCLGMKLLEMYGIDYNIDFWNKLD
jgi:hypothetical protein